MFTIISPQEKFGSLNSIAIKMVIAQPVKSNARELLDSTNLLESVPSHSLIKKTGSRDGLGGLLLS